MSARQWLAIAAALTFSGCLASSCTPAARQEIKAAAVACADRADVKACQARVARECIGNTIVIEQDQCVTETTAARLASCLKLCESPGEAGAAGE